MHQLQRKPVLTIFYQFNPWSSSIGGIQSVIKNFIKYAPDTFELRLVGVGDRYQSIGVWQTLDFNGKPIQFLPLFLLENDNVRRLVPTSIRYTLSLLRRDLSSNFLHFHRLEPSVAAWRWQGDKTLFIHNDLRQQLTAATPQKAILWQRFPGIYYSLERQLVKQFDQIFSCNTESARFYQQQYPRIAHRVSYLKNTVDTELFFPLASEEKIAQRQQLAQQLGLDSDTQFILFAGRLHPQKDPLLLVQAIAALNQPQVHLLIAGDGELAEPLRAEIQRLNLKTQVTLLGAIPQSQLVPLQQLCSLMVLSSVYEGLPMVVLESLACGVPVVTTNCGETPNLLIPGSGLVCEERTPEAIAQALRQVLLQPDQFPVSACTQAARPYAAEMVIQEVFEQMWQRWLLWVG